MSRPAAIVAAVYLIVAVTLIVFDSKPSASGNWITLKNMVPFLVTFPVSAPLAMAGIEPDLSNKATVAMLLAACTGLVYQLVALTARLFTSR
jgi:hypothetical protein